MPKKKIYGDFVADPQYDKASDVANSIQTLRAEMNRELECIDSISDPTFQLVCMFSLLDSLAQESADYPTHDFREAFIKFILKHEKRYDYLDIVEPITLYYHVENYIEESVLIPGLPPEKEVDLDSLGYIDLRAAKDIMRTPKAKEILDYIAKKKGNSYAKQKADEHRLISLIYRMRSKANHEMTGLGMEPSFHKEFRQTEPYYSDVGRMYVEEEKIISDDVCELIIPHSFIRNILTDCIDSYLFECSEQCRIPFSHNQMTRTHRLSWYDK